MNIAILKTEIETDPLVRGYSAMNDLQVAEDMNLVVRPIINADSGMLNYIFTHRYCSNLKGDVQPTSIYGRLQSMSESLPGVDIFGNGKILKMEHIHTAKLFIKLIESSEANNIDFTDTEISAMMMLMVDADVLGIADLLTINNVKNNRQSRGQELKIGKVREGHVMEARLNGK